MFWGFESNEYIWGPEDTKGPGVPGVPGYWVLGRDTTFTTCPSNFPFDRYQTKKWKMDSILRENFNKTRLCFGKSTEALKTCNLGNLWDFWNTEKVFIFDKKSINFLIN